MFRKQLTKTRKQQGCPRKLRRCPLQLYDRLRGSCLVLVISMRDTIQKYNFALWQKRHPLRCTLFFGINLLARFCRGGFTPRACQKRDGGAAVRAALAWKQQHRSEAEINELQSRLK
jgi:hypothetical protein